MCSLAVKFLLWHLSDSVWGDTIGIALLALACCCHDVEKSDAARGGDPPQCGHLSVFGQRLNGKRFFGKRRREESGFRVGFKDLDALDDVVTPELQ